MLKKYVVMLTIMLTNTMALLPAAAPDIAGSDQTFITEANQTDKRNLKVQGQIRTNQKKIDAAILSINELRKNAESKVWGSFASEQYITEMSNLLDYCDYLKQEIRILNEFLKQEPTAAHLQETRNAFQQNRLFRDASLLLQQLEDIKKNYRFDRQPEREAEIRYQIQAKNKAIERLLTEQKSLRSR